MSDYRVQNPESEVAFEHILQDTQNSEILEQYNWKQKFTNLHFLKQFSQSYTFINIGITKQTWTIFTKLHFLSIHVKNTHVKKYMILFIS